MAEAKDQPGVDQSRILVKNIPEGSNDELVTNYLEVVSKSEVTHLHFHPEVLSTVCLATFEDQFTDEAYLVMVKKTNERLLTRQHVVLERVPHTSQVLLNDLDNSAITTDYLELYFERSLKGTSWEVLSVAPHSDIQKAVVSFCTPEAVEHVLNQDHTIKNTKLKVERYFPEYHQHLLQQLKKQGQQPCVLAVEEINLELSPLGESEIGSSSETTEGEESEVETSERGVKRLTQFFEKESDSPPKAANRSPPRKLKLVKEPADYESTGYYQPPIQYHREQRGKTSPSKTTLEVDDRTFPNSSPGRQKVSKAIDISSFGLPQAEPGRLHKSEETADKIDISKFFEKREEEVGDISKPGISSSVDEKVNEHLTHNTGNGRGWKKPVVSVKPSRQSMDACAEAYIAYQSSQSDTNVHVSQTGIIFPEHPPVQRETESLKVESEPIITEEKSFPKPKLVLLKQSGFLEKEACLACAVTLNEQTGVVSFRGTESQIVTAKLAMHESTLGMAEVPVKLPHTLLVPLFSSPSGQSKLQSQLTDKNLNVVVSLENAQLTLTLLTEKEAKLAATELQKIVVSEVVNLEASHLNFVQSDGWRDIVQKIQDRGWVKLDSDSNKKTIFMVGLSKDVADAKKEVLSVLKQNATISKAIQIINPKGKFISHYCKSELIQINDKLRPKKVMVKIKLCGQKFTEVTVNGLKDVIQDGEKEVRSLETKLAEFNVDIPTSVTNTKLWRSFSSSSDLNKWIEEQERSHKCCIVPHLSKNPRPFSKHRARDGRPSKKTRPHHSPDTGFSRTKSLSSIPSEISPFEDLHFHRRSSASSRGSSPVSQQFGQITVTLKSGDITVQRADALVNIIHHSLDLQKGHVCRIFSQKGGPALQQTLLAKGLGKSVSVGDVLETPSSGGLQCKSVLHVVLDQYKQGAIQILRNAVQACLKVSANHSSLSMPTLGCGNLKFPSDLTATAIIDEIKQFGQSTNSNLKTVSIVVFDDKLFPVFKKALQPSSPIQALNPFREIFAIPRRTPADINRRRERQMRRSATYDHRLSSVREFARQGDVTSTQEEIKVHNTTILVKKGNIVTEKANVLVNVTNKDLDLSRGKVSESFLKAGGDDLQQEVGMVGKAKDGDVVVVQSCGSLVSICAHIANVVLPRYNAQTGIQILAQIVKRTLAKAENLGANSVAFPSLGCGKLSYPRDDVARTVIQEIKKYIQTSSVLKMIKIVIFEAPIYAVFVQHLRGSQPVTFSDDDVDDILSENWDHNIDDDDNNDDDDENDGSEDDDDDQIDDNGASSTVGDATPSAPKPIRLRQDGGQSFFAVVNFSDKVEDTKTKLKESLQDRFHQASVDIKKFISEKGKAETVVKSSKAHLEGVAKKNSVEVQFDMKTLTVNIEGKERNVSKAYQRMVEILVETNNNLSKPDYIKQHGTKEDWCELQRRRDCEFPSYWEDNIVKGALRSFKSLITSKSSNLTSPSKPVRDAVEQMFMSTWDQRYVGHGLDSRGIVAGSKPKINKIELIQNPELFQKYFHARQSLFMRVMKREIAPVTKIPASNRQGDILTYSNTTPELTKTLERDVNEAFLFHGTKASAVNSIVSHGVDFRLANDQNMLGKAVYCAESSTKADQYTDEKAQRTNKDLKMMVLRVALGKIYLCEDSNPTKFLRPPCVKCRKERCDHPDGMFDSVLFSNSSKNFREFVVYANEQCYPEFLITYDRA